MKQTFGKRIDTRRTRNRLNMRYPASVQTIAGSLAGTLFDLSLNGARFRPASGGNIQSAVGAGRDVVLKWAAYEAFGTVTRQDDGFYSIVFRPGITPAMLLATRDLDDELARNPAAGPGGEPTLP